MTNPDRDNDALIAAEGNLRFIQIHNQKLLQRFEWSYKLGRFDWFDVFDAGVDHERERQ